MRRGSPQVFVTFLGTSAAWPSAVRNVASTAIKWGGDVLLFDCGEGTQRQLQRSDVSYMAVSRLFITHLHGDHHFGIPGLLKTMQLNERSTPLEVFGPPGIEELMDIYGRLAPVASSFDVVVRTLRDGDEVDGPGYRVRARGLNHRAFNLGYAFEEPERPGRFDKARALELGVPEGPLFGRLQSGEDVQTPAGSTVRSSEVTGPPRAGRKVVVSGDTGPCAALTELARDASLFVCEATYCDDMLDKAQEFGHMTSRAAATTAAQAGVGRLVLTHVSPRYPNGSAHLDEARDVFKDVIVARDLETVEVPLPS